MKQIFTSFLFTLITINFSYASPDSYYDYQDGNQYLCQIVNETPSTTCVSNCVSRSYSGTCIQYGSDYCDSGHNIACVPRCVSRSYSGTCIDYGTDFCGVSPSCTEYCSSRSYSGTCIEYGEDICN